jgi:hypothetical protein
VDATADSVKDAVERRRRISTQLGAFRIARGSVQSVASARRQEVGKNLTCVGVRDDKFPVKVITDE